MNSQGTTRRLRRSNQFLVFIAFLLFVLQNAVGEEQRVLRVAADPNNLPFSNDRGEGFENKIAQLVAREMGAKLEYDWRAQHRGVFRDTLKSGEGDGVIGCPRAVDKARTPHTDYPPRYLF